MTSSFSYTLPLPHQGSSTHNQRDAWVEVDLNRLEKNIQIINSSLKHNAEQAQVKVPQIMAVVKASAYGHGATAIVEVLTACGVPWLGVASADEGSELRNAGCKLPILILSPTPSWAVFSALDQGLDLTISSLNQLQDLSRQLSKYERSVRVHLKVDTGMHRLGMNDADAEKAIAVLKENKKFKLVSVYSHLAIASDYETTKKQKENFDRFLAIFRQANYQPDFYHLAPCEAVKSFPFTYYDFVRIGLHLYGMESNTVSSELLPIMSLRGRINQISSVISGASVGYGLTWKAKRATRLANIPIGYADGVDRRLSNRMQGLLHGRLINQIGTISMDQMLFDITDIPQAKEGDVITLIGSDDFAPETFGDQSGEDKNEDKNIEKKCLYLADWANELDTMVRELSCRLHMRLPYIYTRKPIPRELDNDLLLASKQQKGK